MNGLILAGVVIGTLAVALVVGRYHHSARLREWQALLEPDAGSVQEMAELCALDGAMADDAFTSALRARDRFDMLQAVRLLDLSCRIIEEATPSRLARLRAMGRMVRMTMAILPMQAVPARSFRLAQMTALAGIGACLHLVLVAPAERFLLRVRVLGAGFRLVVRLMRSSANHAMSQPGQRVEWERFERGLADWQTLDAEHLQTLKVLVAAVAAELSREPHAA